MIPNGPVCRTWDDLLTVSAQRWEALREELTSGRLAAFLAANGLAEMVPSADAPGTPDERLDQWLEKIPTTRASHPELDVHPATINVRALAGGGITIQHLAIANAGYRLLRSTIQVEPGGESWIRIPGSAQGKPLVTVDRTEVPIEIEIPESLSTPRTGSLRIESNGGTRRVAVRLERPATPELIPELSSDSTSEGDRRFVAWLEKQPVQRRLSFGALTALVLRLLVAFGELLPLGATGAGEVVPRMLGPVLVLAGVGGAVALALSARRVSARDLPPAGFAGACLGAFAAALVVACCRTLEPMLGPTLARSIWGTGLLWAGLGAGVAGLSVVLAPPSSRSVAEPLA